MSPNRLILGRETAMPVDVVLGRPEEERREFTSYEEFTDDLAARLEKAFQLARENLGKAAERRKNAYDLRVKGSSFKVGQWVWYLYQRRYKGRSPKWQRHYTGPFLVVKALPPSNFVIQRSKNSAPKVVHADKLKLWGGEPLPSWLEETRKDETEKEVLKEAVPDQAEEVRKKRRKGKKDGPPEIEEEEQLASPADHGDHDEAKRPARKREPPRRLADYV
jgi:hypothetical protein